MIVRTHRWFVFCAGFLLVVTGLAKLLSVAEPSGRLLIPDPVLLLPYHALLWGVGLLEIAVALVCFLVKDKHLAIALLTWLSTSFAAYRIALWGTGYREPCSCLGTLTTVVGVDARVADLAMVGVLLFFLTGSLLAQRELGAESQVQQV